MVVFFLFGCDHGANKVIPDAEKSVSGGGGLPSAESESATLSAESSASPEFNLAKALQTQEEGFKKKDLKKAAASCEALNSEKLQAQLVPNMACRCFAVKLAGIIDSAASKKSQQPLCGGATGTRDILDKKRRDNIPCERELKLSNPLAGEETLNKILLNLFRNGTDLDSLKNHFSDLSQQLQKIFPISDKILAGTPQCKFPKQFFDTPKDFILKEGDIHYVLGYLKTAAVILQMGSQYEFNLNPKKIVKTVLGKDGEKLKAVPEFLAGDADSREKTVEASAYDEDFPLSFVERGIEPKDIVIENPLPPIKEKFDEEPFLALAKNVNFVELKPLVESALQHLTASASKKKAVVAGMSEGGAQQWEKLRETLSNTWASFDEASPQRTMVNLHQLLENPPSVNGILEKDLKKFPNLEKLAAIPINFLRVGEEQKKIRENFFCTENGVEAEVEYCEPPAGKDPLCKGKCEVRAVSIPVSVVKPNTVAILAALHEALRLNFEPQFSLQSIPNKICNSRKTEFFIDVEDLEKDEVALTAPKAAALPAGVEISPSAQGDLQSFKIIVNEGTAKNKYKIFLGASDGKGPALVNRTMAPQGTFEKAPEVVQEIELVVDECPPELL